MKLSQCSVTSFVKKGQPAKQRDQGSQKGKTRIKVADKGVCRPDEDRRVQVTGVRVRAAHSSRCFSTKMELGNRALSIWLGLYICMCTGVPLHGAETTCCVGGVGYHKWDGPSE